MCGQLEVISKVAAETARVIDKLDALDKANTSTVILMGSCARNVTHDRSDIDILVIQDDVAEEPCRIKLDRPGHIDLQQDTRTRFLKRLQEGDDYPAWALRFGVPIRDPGGWWEEQVSAESNNPHWPDWRLKVNPTERRLSVSHRLLSVGDVSGASEELMFAASHVARAILLKQGEFPLSRMEMPSQLLSRSPDLSRLLSELIFGGGTGLDSEALRHGETILRQELDRLQVESGEGYQTTVGSSSANTHGAQTNKEKNKAFSNQALSNEGTVR